eukprot:TRINITY_DN83851_c0_g1_i1.p1 TRINITY_DN83851_c0_g1~~TRINITY_DN83851_c0_g1_i1.p1  ORF type:complete len:283 (+),score=5.29 TRINITY_DN83851_c0_g1_i1:164-1012(+)
MHQTRLWDSQRLWGMGFICVVLCVILSIHCIYVFIVYGPKLWCPWAVLILFVYHMFFTGLLASFYQCILTDPGLVPPNWGFYMGDETKRRRYCKMCNVWKPDRTHHCSICNRCILNMDHHCPWINNCVGFYNRKFFIQLLLYVYSTIAIIVVSTFPDLIFRGITTVRQISHGVWDVLLDFTGLAVLVMWILCLMLVATLTNFIKFHMKLVLENYTTIENLEREEGAKSKFDIGRRRNWEQVFGSNASLWWMPLHTQASRPVGDGVRWRVHYTRVIDEDEEPS